MRATRAYVAGFGTAGSLLAGAAMVFVLASAVVAYRGWPQVGAASTPAAVVVSRPHVATGSRVERLLAANVAAVSSTAAGAAGSRTARNRGASGRTAGSSVRVRISGTRTGAVAAPPGTVSPTGPTPVTTTGGCGTSCATPSLPSTLSTAVQNATGAVGNTVAATGKTLGSTVSGLTSAVASKLAGVSPTVAGVVSKTGAVVGGVVGGTTGAVGKVVTGAGHAVGGLLGTLGRSH